MPLAQMIYERFCTPKQLKVEFASMAYKLKIFPYGSLRKPQIYNIYLGGVKINNRHAACPNTCLRSADN